MRCLSPRLFLNLVFTIICLCSLFISTPAQQRHPNNDRGFNGESFDTDSIDNVNLYNGNLTLTLPLGQVFNAGGSFNYKLTLVYNSNVWEVKNVYDPNAPDGPAYNDQAIPDPKTNAGLGWHLSFGALYQPGTSGINETNRWVYVAPDGSEHIFYESLHGDSASSTTAYLYTRDGTYLRLNPGLRRLEFPDGQTHFFSNTKRGRATRLQDAWGNYLDITMNNLGNTANPDDLRNAAWVLSDSNGHQHNINFDASGQVSDITLAAPHGASATYRLLYENTTVQRHNKNKYNWPSNQVRANVSFLREVVLPENAGSYSFTYYTDYNSDVVTGGYLPGAVKTATLPTGGRYRWEYETYAFHNTHEPPDNPPIPPTDIDFITSTSDGVRRKDIYLTGSGTVAGTYTYKQKLCEINNANNQIIAAYTTTTVRNPEHDETINYFNTTPFAWDYSLPYTTLTNPQHWDAQCRPQSPATFNGMFLSQEIYERTGPNSTPVRRRALYTKYVPDRTDPNVRWFSYDPRDMNRRPSGQTTVFYDDTMVDGTQRYQSTTYSNFDGLGHFRTVTSEGNFVSGVDSVRVKTTNYNPSSGVYDFDPATGAFTNTFVMPAGNRPWLTNTYDEIVESENDRTAKRQYCFDTQDPNVATPRGALKRTRVLLGATPGSNDVLTEHERNASGLVTAEKYYGGDSGGVGIGALCGATLPANQYLIKYDYAFGTMKYKAYMNAAGTSEILVVFNKTIDPTGVELSEEDASGVRINYEYDTLGRRIRNIPATGNGGPTEMIYQPVDASTVPPTQAAVTAITYGTGTNSTTVISQKKKILDSFGRLAREDESVPTTVTGTELSRRDIEYNVMGWKVRVTERMAGTPTSATQFLDHDAFGRPLTIRPPDGANHDVRVVYGGNRTTTTRVKIGLKNQSTGGLLKDYVSTTEHRDLEGRIWKVIEGEYANSAGEATITYTYDIGGRIETMSLTPAAGGASQQRSYNYDNRGFLRSETHPEYGTTYYRGYDALAHPTQIYTNSTGGSFDLTNIYDRAERVTTVKESAPSQRLLKEFFYEGTGTTAANRSKGKLTRAIRHNYIDSLSRDVTVTESYTYGGIGGRISSRTTTVNTGTTEAFTQSFAYNDLGLTSQLGYPRCSQGGCSGKDSVRNVTRGYTGDYLTSIGDSNGGTYVSRILYYPNGMFKRVNYPNDTAWFQTNDPSAMTRPARIYTTGLTANWDSGAYSYDGAGNIVTIGTAGTTPVDNFFYDKIGRLQEAQISNGNQQWKQQYTFDGFSNITSIVTTEPGGTVATRTIPVSTSSNKLSDPTNGGRFSYDTAGNLTKNGALFFTYDGLNMLKSLQGASNNIVYAYTPSDERIWTYNGTDGSASWKIRDLSGNVLREYSQIASSWSWNKDYIHIGRQVAVAAYSGGNLYFYPDHLGTPRLIADQNKNIVESNKYLPFGEEATTSTDETGEAIRFTGHERDINGAGKADTLDYMHARYYHSFFGRFLSIDPILADSTRAGGWSRYSYVQNNPVNAFDPTGKQKRPIQVPSIEPPKQGEDGPTPYDEIDIELMRTGGPAGVVVGFLKDLLNAALDSIPPGAVLNLQIKEEWTEEQKQQAREKGKALNEAAERGELVVTRVKRKGTSASKRYKQAGGEVQPGQDVDHVIDLQLGGADEVLNMKPLDSSVNRSFGKQIQLRIKGLGLQPGEKIRMVNVIEPLDSRPLK